MGEARATRYDPLLASLDPMSLVRWRRWAAGSARGRVLELGVGSGRNLAYYAAAESVFGIDPDRSGLVQAQTRATRIRVPVTLIQAGGEGMPFPDATFDFVVGTLVLCTIPDVRRTLSEVRRILVRQGGLRLFEHVRANQPLVGGVLDRLTPLWSRVAGGCHLNRDAVAAVADAGFVIRSIERHYYGLAVCIDAARG